MTRKTHLRTRLFEYFVEIVALRRVNVHRKVVEVLTLFVGRVSSVARKRLLCKRTELCDQRRSDFSERPNVSGYVRRDDTRLRRKRGKRAAWRDDRFGSEFVDEGFTALEGSVSNRPRFSLFSYNFSLFIS